MTIQKQCIACAEDIKLEAKLCKHCGTNQEESLYLANAQVQTGRKSTKKNNSCPMCREIDTVSKVSSIVDRGRKNSSSIGFGTQLGSGRTPFTNLSIGSSSSQLAERLTIDIPQVEFAYKFVDFAIGCCFAAVGLFGFVFKSGSPLDSGPFNILFASIVTLAIGPILGIYTAVVRKNNQKRNIYGIQLWLSEANEALRSSYYCSRDDLVFNGEYSASPEDFVEYLMNREDGDYLT